ncbi:hypothetical protein [Bradyrhizobium tropiciagri]|uniref:hypothetical protein n=1 Tax=Bradyrhizobium tropiciagri TaxID=312253 RepID=UPI000ADBE4AF|nr:hypothetical protein [Bradyrhizobium tropiciagri]
MTKTLALAASMVMLVALSGQAFAGAAQLNARSFRKAPSVVDRKPADAFDGFEQRRTTESAYRYYGGPKWNE